MAAFTTSLTVIQQATDPHNYAMIALFSEAIEDRSHSLEGKSPPGAKHMTGSSAFSAAAQSQSTVPSVSQGSVWGVLNITRSPAIPGCSRHFGSRAAAFGSWSGILPMIWKRVG
jgi:hypothetical protein